MKERRQIWAGVEPGPYIMEPFGFHFLTGLGWSGRCLAPQKNIGLFFKITLRVITFYGFNNIIHPGC